MPFSINGFNHWDIAAVETLSFSDNARGVM